MSDAPLGKSPTQSVAFAGPLTTVKPTTPPPSTVGVASATVGTGGVVRSTMKTSLRCSPPGSMSDPTVAPRDFSQLDVNSAHLPFGEIVALGKYQK